MVINMFQVFSRRYHLPQNMISGNQPYKVLQMHWTAFRYDPCTQTNVNFSENIQTALMGLALLHLLFFKL